MEKNNEKVFDVVNTRKSKKGLTKRLCALGIATMLTFSALTMPASAATMNHPDVMINDVLVNYGVKESPFYSEKDGCTFLPLSTLSRYGYKTYTYNGVLYSGCEYGTLAFTEGSKEFTYNNKKYEMPAPYKVVDGVTYVPVVVISTATNAKTEWNNETFRINFVTNEKKVDQDRIDALNKVIQNNSDLTYDEKNVVKTYVKKYFDLMDPTLDETDAISKVLTKLDIRTNWNGSKEPVYTIKNGIIYYNYSRQSIASKDDAIRNALTYMFNQMPTKPLLRGVDELISAELMDTNTNQTHAMVIISKMLNDIVGHDVLMSSYKHGDMSKIKKELMSIYDDEALYKNLEDLIARISYFDNAYVDGQSIGGLTKRKQQKMYEEDVQNVYGILDVYYQCKFGSLITRDDVMEGYLNELLTHGDMKSFKYERKIFVPDKYDYSLIYKEAQTGYNRGVSTYKYYDEYRPTKGKGDGQILLYK